MTLGKLILLGSALAVLVLPLAVDQARADDGVQVVSLRSEKVPLYDKPNGAKTGEVTKDTFKGPWRVLASSPEGFLQVEVEGKTYWVRPYAVETNKPIRAPADCGGVVALREPKSGATRGIGEECKK